MTQGLALQEAGTIEEAIQAFELAVAVAAPPISGVAAAGPDLPRQPNGCRRRSSGSNARRRRLVPTPEEGSTLLYELADALEVSGETARALAVCLEFLAGAGDFRDVKARVARLEQSASARVTF